MFCADYSQVQKTYLIDQGKNIFLTYFGLEVDRDKYKLTPSSDACHKNIDYD